MLNYLPRMNILRSVLFYELLWNSRFELNDEWPFVRW